MNQRPVHHMHITHIGGPTTLIEIGHLRILTDPTFDPAGSRYVAGPKELVKLAAPALAIATLGPVDLVLLGHDHHADNLDRAGRTYISQAKHVLTTPAGAGRLGGETRGVSPWETVSVTGADGQRVRVTATPARHGPQEIKGAIGDVTGWIVEWDGQRRGALYVSGDTVLFAGLEEIGRRFQIGTALLHFGAAQVDVYGPVFLTFTAAEGAQFAQMLSAATVIPIHYEGWAHFTEGRAAIEQAFAVAGIEQRLCFLPIGQSVLIDV